MHVVSVTVWVKPGEEDKFLAATLENARATRREPGNLRFDVNRCIENPSRFLLYEVYRDENAFKAHQQTDHYFRWRDGVGDWMERKREGVKHESIFPEAEDLWVSK